MITAWCTDTECFASSDTLVPWWSVTKTVIAVACLRLAEQGRLDLDAPLQGHAFSVADLLAHRAGVPNYTAWPDYIRATEALEPAWPDEEVLTRADRLGPNFDVGQGWSYSNTGYLMVRRLLEEVTGTSVGQVLREQVFEPLELSTPRVVLSDKDLIGCKWLDGVGYDPKWVYHRMVVGSAADACGFMHAVVAGDFLTPSSFARMTERIDLGGPVAGRPWDTAGYGLGLMFGDMTGVGRVLGHSGNGPQSSCNVSTVRTAKGLMTVAAFSNDGSEDACEWRVQEIATAHTSI
jgi:CubicO group peptidase (beta-lactamase class C family)